MPVPHWFRITAIVGTLWLAFGCFVYVVEVMMTPEQIAALPSPQRELTQSTPAWAIGAWAIAVWVGLIGMIGLVLRRRWSVPLLGISLLAVLVQQLWFWVFSNATELVPPVEMLFPAMILLISVGLWLLARHARRRLWLR